MTRAPPALLFSLLLIPVLVVLGALPVCAATDADHGIVEPYLQALKVELDPRAASAIDIIQGTDRRLLAARAYFHSRAHLADRWSWSEVEVQAFDASPERAALDAAIAAVRSAFSVANPGHTLFVNPAFRSLDVQIQHWNSNQSVALAGQNLLEAMVRAVSATDFPGPATPEGRRRFQALLSAYKPDPTPTIAAPGLSLHGHLHAIDFQIQAGGRIVAGPETSSIPTTWDAAGWTAKLQAAVASAAAGFVGPLRVPYEPWHYDYHPE